MGLSPQAQREPGERRTGGWRCNTSNGALYGNQIRKRSERVARGWQSARPVGPVRRSHGAFGLDSCPNSASSQRLETGSLHANARPFDLSRLRARPIPASKCGRHLPQGAKPARADTGPDSRSVNRKAFGDASGGLSPQPCWPVPSNMPQKKKPFPTERLSWPIPMPRMAFPTCLHMLPSPERPTRSSSS